MRSLVSIPLVLVLVAVHLHLLEGVKDDDGKQMVFHYYHGNNPNETAYVEFLEALRGRLASGIKAHGIPVLRRPADVPTEERFIQAQLDNGANVITLVIDVVNVNVVGYLVVHGNNDDAPTSTFHYYDGIPHEVFQVFPESPRLQHDPLGYTVSYPDYVHGRWITIGNLGLAINSLFNNNTQEDARIAVLHVVNIMVSEAVRVKYLEHSIRRFFHSAFLADQKHWSIKDAWSDLSEAIQLSGEIGVFNRTLLVAGVGQIKNVQQVLQQARLAVLLYKCTTHPPKRNKNIIRMPVAAGGLDDAEQCPVIEPTANIIGGSVRGGGVLCVDVRDGIYNDFNQIQLSPCNRDLTQQRQLWTFRRDGTIRSNGKCLTTYGFAPGSFIMIYDCNRAASEATKWTLSSGGTIRHPRSGLVLAAESSMWGTILTVATDNNSPSQAWSANFNWVPQINHISGFENLCLQANGNSFLLLSCANREQRQQWAFHGDNTIRPHSDPSRCVEANRPQFGETTVVLRMCTSGATERWTFMGDGTILNPHFGEVLSVTTRVAHKYSLTIEPHTGKPNQQWISY